MKKCYSKFQKYFFLSYNLIQNALTPIVTTRARITSKNLKELGFICNEQRQFHINSYSNGGLGPCESEESKAKL